jgi:predicted dienelactone hydrolase
MIVFIHGYDVNPSTYALLLNEWASKGFVVAAPIFPGENSAAVAQQHGANTEADLVNEPADIAFVTHQILTDSAARLGGAFRRRNRRRNAVVLDGD